MRCNSTSASLVAAASALEIRAGSVAIKDAMATSLKCDGEYGSNVALSPVGNGPPRDANGLALAVRGRNGILSEFERDFHKDHLRIQKIMEKERK